jgi:hypothetical protein
MAIFQIYAQFNGAFFPKGTPFSMSEPLIFYGASYVIFFILSVLLNARGKFTVNIVLAGCLVLIYVVTINLVRGHG